MAEKAWCFDTSTNDCTCRVPPRLPVLPDIPSRVKGEVETLFSKSDSFYGIIASVVVVICLVILCLSVYKYRHRTRIWINKYRKDTSEGQSTGYSMRETEQME
ncbi:uncharacterized protein [Antedon mediterranea]|uniref:uncharacterized protein n=1 Tax=Antedon mediterranea TaxID=105859 RepID=UPI003AF6BD97